MIELLLLSISISIPLFIATYKRLYDIPKPSIYIFIIGTILTFIIYGIGFSQCKLLDMPHPVYSDPETDISTLAIIISLTGGSILTIPINLYYVLKDIKEEIRIQKHMEALEKEKE